MRKLSLVFLFVSSLAFGRGSLSDAMKAPRPKGGETFGLYLMGKKVGYCFSDFVEDPKHPGEVQAINNLVFKATVGNTTAERRHDETRVYEDSPHGRLLSFTVVDSGDGGEQRLEGMATAHGLRVIRKRPGLKDEILNLPPAHETIEDADSARVAILRGKGLEGQSLDAMDLSEYKVTTTLGPLEERVIAGVKASLRKVTTYSEKDKVPLDAWFTREGAMVEVSFGSNLSGRAEPPAVAHRLDQVEIFGLTRVPLPKALPATSRQIPGKIRMTVLGLPEHFQHPTYRQLFRSEDGGKTVVTLLGTPPDSKNLATLPLKAPQDAAPYLKSTIAVESSDPKIRALSKKILGGETDAYEAAKQIVSWVGEHMEKTYGASADRATDVLRQMKGDCTEHSLLAVALLRAAGIPARRVDGLVYVVSGDQVPALYWHEWVEAYVGEWTQMDPTFQENVADATHFALGEESSAEITPLLGTLKVLDVQ